MDVNIAPVKMEKYSARKPLVFGDGPHEGNFESYNYFPAIASKYSTKA